MLHSASVAYGAQGRGMGRLQNGRDGLQDRDPRKKIDCGTVTLAKPDRVGVRGRPVAKTAAVSS